MNLSVQLTQQILAMFGSTEKISSVVSLEQVAGNIHGFFHKPATLYTVN
jgi:hypothetical protein